MANASRCGPLRWKRLLNKAISSSEGVYAVATSPVGGLRREDIDGERQEPIELVTADVEDTHQGGVMQALGERKAELVHEAYIKLGNASGIS